MVMHVPYLLCAIAGARRRPSRVAAELRRKNFIACIARVHYNAKHDKMASIYAVPYLEIQHGARRLRE